MKNRRTKGNTWGKHTKLINHVPSLSVASLVFLSSIHEKIPENIVSPMFYFFFLFYQFIFTSLSLSFSFLISSSFSLSYTLSLSSSIFNSSIFSLLLLSLTQMIHSFLSLAPFNFSLPVLQRKHASTVPRNATRRLQLAYLLWYAKIFCLEQNTRVCLRYEYAPVCLYSIYVYPGVRNQSENRGKIRSL